MAQGVDLEQPQPVLEVRRLAVELGAPVAEEARAGAGQPRALGQRVADPVRERAVLAQLLGQRLEAGVVLGQVGAARRATGSVSQTSSW